MKPTHADVVRCVVGAALVAAGGAHAATTPICCSGGGPEGFDPARHAAGTTFNARSQPLFGRRVEFETGGTAVVPGLAQSWTVGPDGLVHPFMLRSGVKFHATDWFKPTRDLNADGVAFSVDRTIDKDNTFNKAAPASVDCAQDMGLADNIVKIDRLDPMTLRFSLKKVDAALRAKLAMDFESIQSAEHADPLFKAGESDTGMFGRTADTGDPDNFLATLLGCGAVGGSNDAQGCDKAYDALVTQARQTTDITQRTRLDVKAREVVEREAVWGTMAHSAVLQPTLENVEGYKTSPFGSVPFYGASLK